MTKDCRTYTNDEIYFLSKTLSEAFEGEEDKLFPAKIIYLIQKNKESLFPIALDIEESRLNILSKFDIDINGENVTIPNEKIEEINKELASILEMEQEVDIYLIEYDDLDKLELTQKQMDALMFMVENPFDIIEAEEEEEE